MSSQTIGASSRPASRLGESCNVKRLANGAARAGESELRYGRFLVRLPDRRGPQREPDHIVKTARPKARVIAQLHARLGDREGALGLMTYDVEAFAKTVVLVSE